MQVFDIQQDLSAAVELVNGHLVDKPMASVLALLSAVATFIQANGQDPRRYFLSAAHVDPETTRKILAQP